MTRKSRREIERVIENLDPPGDDPEAIVIEETVVGTEYDREESDLNLDPDETRTETTELQIE